MSADRNTIYHEIDAERGNQDAQWGGPEHDDEHGPGDWFRFIHQQGEKFLDEAQGAFRAPEKLSVPAVIQMGRARLVKIAALAVAGLESIDRQEAAEGDKQ